MQVNKAKFERVVEEVKAKTNDPKWLRAIEKAAKAILNGEMIVTPLAHGALVTTANRKAVVMAPVAVKSPQNEIPPSLQSPATGPVVTGHRGEVSTPTSFDPTQAPEDRRHCHGFPNREADST